MQIVEAYNSLVATGELPQPKPFALKVQDAEILGHGGIAIVQRQPYVDEHGHLQDVAIKSNKATVDEEQLEKLEREDFFLNLLSTEAIEESRMLRFPRPYFFVPPRQVNDPWVGPFIQTEIVMSELPGIDLKELLRQEGKLSIERAIGITDSLLYALEELQLVGHGMLPTGKRNCPIVQKDVKPANIRITAEGVKVFDFSLAEYETDELHDIVEGTPAYIEPTHIIDSTVDRRVDLYATALVLFEMITGKNLNALIGGTQRDLLMALISGHYHFKMFEELHTCTNIPQPLIDFILDETHPDREHFGRSKDAFEMRQKLARVQLQMKNIS